MSYYRFKENDIFTNTIVAHPHSSFMIYSGSVYYRNTPYESGSIFYGNVTHVPVGAISLYEVNVDRPESDHDYDYENHSGTKTMIHPFVVKSGDNIKFKTISTGSYNEEDWGSTLTSSFNYPLSASLSRDLYPEKHLASAIHYSAQHNLQLSPHEYDAYNIDSESGDRGIVTVSSSYIEALKNTLNYYTPLSDQYAFTSSARNRADITDQFPTGTPYWDKGIQPINLISIPSIYYGESIKRGSVSVKFYISGTLAAECADIYENGELIEVSGTYDRFESGSIAGVVLYNEGFLLLTGSWDISAGHQAPYTGGSATSPSWLYWGVGITSSLNATGSLVPAGYQIGSKATFNGSVDYTKSPGYNLPSSSFSLDFQGVEHIPVKTMLAHAPIGELYYSNNPTFTVANTASLGDEPADFGVAHENFISGSIQKAVTGSTFYIEDKDLEIKNINSSSFPNYTASFEKTTYISKIALYDDQKNIIGIAKLAQPVKKTINRNLTFKLKLDL